MWQCNRTSKCRPTNIMYRSFPAPGSNYALRMQVIVYDMMCVCLSLSLSLCSSSTWLWQAACPPLLSSQPRNWLGEAGGGGYDAWLRPYQLVLRGILVNRANWRCPVKAALLGNQHHTLFLRSGATGRQRGAVWSALSASSSSFLCCVCLCSRETPGTSR